MTYEYLCAGCGHEWEAEQSISAKPLKRCPECGKNQAKRQISGGTGFVLKGGGWYADLYGSPAASKSSDSEATDGEATDKSSGQEGKKESSGQESKTDSTASDSTNKKKTESKSSDKGSGKKRKTAA